jgi:hypothetical protein
MDAVAGRRRPHPHSTQPLSSRRTVRPRTGRIWPEEQSCRRARHHAHDVARGVARMTGHVPRHPPQGREVICSRLSATFVAASGASCPRDEDLSACSTWPRTVRGMAVWELVEWGTLPEALGAVGTVTAASVAVVLARREGKRAESAESERDALRADQMKDQAARVVAWVEPRPRVTSPGSRYTRMLDAQSGHQVTVRNASDRPVFDVSAELVHADGGERMRVKRWPVIPPMADVSEPVTTWVQEYNEPPFVCLSFRDASDRRWLRGEAGVLTQQVADGGPPANPD